MTVQPGLHCKYSNSGFSLVGAAMERATGRSYAELRRDRILQSLRLSGCGLTSQPPHPDLALSYRIQEGKIVPLPASPLFEAQAPASSLVSTVGDIARFAQGHLVRGPVAPIPDAVKDLLLSAQVPSGETGAVGLGWHYAWRENMSHWFHNGAWNSG